MVQPSGIPAGGQQYTFERRWVNGVGLPCSRADRFWAGGKPIERVVLLESGGRVEGREWLLASERTAGPHSPRPTGRNPDHLRDRGRPGGRDWLAASGLGILLGGPGHALIQVDTDRQQGRA
jgi:hypothetical protein